MEETKQEQYAKDIYEQINKKVGAVVESYTRDAVFINLGYINYEPEAPLVSIAVRRGECAGAYNTERAYISPSKALLLAERLREAAEAAMELESTFPDDLTTWVDPEFESVIYSRPLETWAELTDGLNDKPDEERAED